MFGRKKKYKVTWSDDSTLFRRVTTAQFKAEMQAAAKACFGRQPAAY